MMFPYDYEMIISDLKLGILNDMFYKKYGFNKYLGIKVRKSKIENLVDLIVVTWNREKAIYDNEIDLNLMKLKYIGAGLEGEQSGKRQNKSLITQFNEQTCPIIFASKVGKELKYICLLYTEKSGLITPNKENDFKFNFNFKMKDIDHTNLQILLNVIPKRKPAWLETKKNQKNRKNATYNRIISDQKLRDLLKELQFIGDIGEIIAYYFEIDRLKSIGLSKYAGLVEHTSVTKGHGLGYDIKSYDYTLDGKNVMEIYIEVKTTKNSEENIMSFTKNEFNFLSNLKDSYRIYRVFDIYENDNGLVVHKYPFEKFEVNEEITKKYLFKLKK